MILVKIGRMGERVKEYALNADCSRKSNIDLALSAAKITVLPDEEIRINGNIHNYYGVDHTVTDGDLIIIQKKPQIVSITVKIARIGTPLATFTIPANSKVRNILVEADITLHTNEEIWLQRIAWPKHEVVNDSTSLINGDIIILEKKKDPIRDEVIKILEAFEEDAYHDEAPNCEKTADEIISIIKFERK